jgi:NADH-quinone oxidoreductase subunit C
MDQQELKNIALRELGDLVLSASEPYDLLTIEVPVSGLIDAVTRLRDAGDLQCTFLTDLCAVHYPEDPGREIAVVYHLHSLTRNFRVRLKVFVPVSEPKVPSLTSLFRAANWMERETYDFYGVQFEGHPDLRRILNVDHMDYFPLRKEYALEDETREDKDDRFFGR